MPPLSESGVIAAHPTEEPTTDPAGHVVGSVSVLPGLGDCVTPLKIWLKVGTRKPVLYEPRNIIHEIGRNLAVNFGLKVDPKPV